MNFNVNNILQIIFLFRTTNNYAIISYKICFICKMFSLIKHATNIVVHKLYTRSCGIATKTKAALV